MLYNESLKAVTNTLILLREFRKRVKESVLYVYTEDIFYTYEDKKICPILQHMTSMGINCKICPILQHMTSMGINCKICHILQHMTSMSISCKISQRLGKE